MTDGGWHYGARPVNLELPPQKIVSVGWLKGLTPLGITLVSTKSDFDDSDTEGYLSPLTIPAGAILSIKKI
jgi:hypothetical protein